MHVTSKGLENDTALPEKDGKVTAPMVPTVQEDVTVPDIVMLLLAVAAKLNPEKPRMDIAIVRIIIIFFLFMVPSIKM